MRKLIDLLAIASTIDPQSLGTAASSDYIALKDGEQALFVVLTGVLGDVIDFALWEATSSGGAGAQAITGKAIVQGAATEDLKQFAINITRDELSDTYTFVKGVCTVGASAGLVTVVGLLGNLRYGPASEHDLATVDQLIS